jgi:ArpU family phage transcriptional regulator
LFLKVVDGSKTREKVIALLKCYRRLNRTKEDEALRYRIIQTVQLLDETSKKILLEKYINPYEVTNISIYMSLYMSESQFYRVLDKAYSLFAESYNNAELLVYKEE